MLFWGLLSCFTFCVYGGEGVWVRICVMSLVIIGWSQLNVDGVCFIQFSLYDLTKTQSKHESKRRLMYMFLMISLYLQYDKK